jgi:putative ABC transport system permease protein
VNQTAARRYFGGSPVGRRLGSGQLDTEIIGVVGDARTQSLHDPPVAMAYFPVDQKPVGQPSLTNLDVRVTGAPAAVEPLLRKAIRESEPNLLAGDVAPMSRRLSRDLSREEVVTSLAFGFGGLTLLLAALGLYGVLSYGVALRTQEIGVRMALGARRAEVLAMIAGQSARLTILGTALGLVASFGGARLLSGLLFGVDPLDPLTFILVPVGFALVAALASFVPARHATRVDPLVALRCE